MKTILCTVVLLILGMTPTLACDYPARAKITNGAEATKEEMLASQKSVKAYMAAMESYLTCIAEEEEAAKARLENPDEATLVERDKVFNKKHNAAVEEMEIVADEFNQQVRAYKAQSE